jgi:hypothetical protein
MRNVSPKNDEKNSAKLKRWLAFPKKNVSLQPTNES